MSEPLVITGRYTGRTFIPDGPLPDAEGTAELVVTPTSPDVPPAGGSIFDFFGKAPVLRTAEDIAEQVREERDSWGEP
ncbi:MAG: hypothetical protein ACRC7O_10055 [Fimbriiglobus sp.]